MKCSKHRRLACKNVQLVAISEMFFFYFLLLAKREGDNYTPKKINEIKNLEQINE